MSWDFRRTTLWVSEMPRTITLFWQFANAASRCQCPASFEGTADVVTEKTHGAGVEEIIEQLLADDLRSLQPRFERHEYPSGPQRKW